MKKGMILLITSILLGLNLNAQEITIDEPEFEGEIVFVKNNEAFELDPVTTFSKSGQSAALMLTGMGKAKSKLVAKGKTSSLQIKQSDKLYFIYNHGDNSTNPRKVVQLLKFEIKGKNRIYVVSSSSSITGQTQSGVTDAIKFKAKKYGEGSYLIVVSDLAPGEYGFFLGNSETYDGSFFTITD